MVAGRMKARTTTAREALDRRAEEMLHDLKCAGFKMTPQRMAIVRLFARDLGHPTAQDLFERLRPAFPSMSFATVYNTLDTLAQMGLSRTLRLGDAKGGARFDPNPDPHHHAVCDACGAILDLPAPSLLPAKGEALMVRERAPGFTVRAVEHVYRGVCASCHG